MNSPEVWLRRDLINALAATAQAGRQAADVGASPEYQRGYIAAIKMLGLFLGINPGQIIYDDVEGDSYDGRAL